MELNREQIIKALECISAKKDVLCAGCTYRKYDGLACHRNGAKDALALIKELTEKIGDLECKVEEYRADAISWQATVDEISNGDKALYDAINSLRRKSREYDELNLKAYNLNMEIKELTEENERLRAQNETLEIYNADYKFRNKELTAFNRRWAKECADLQDECEQIKSDTVREMRERLTLFFANDDTVKYIEVDAVYINEQIEKIAKEMEEDRK